MSAPLNENPNPTSSFVIETVGEFSEPIRPACYVTERNRIDVICHHCGRPIHLGENPLKDNSYRRRLAKTINRQKHNEPYFAKLIRPITNFFPAGKEFSNLGLHYHIPVHCEYCKHKVHKELAFVSISIFAFFTLLTIAFLQIVSFAVFITLSLFWGAVVAYFLFQHFIDAKHPSNSIPPFPLLGRSATIKIKEYQNGSITLSQDGKYITITDANSCKGELDYSLRITQSDEQRFQKYMQKFKLRDRDSFQFLTSFLLFDNLRPIIFANPYNVLPDRINTIRIRGGGEIANWLKKLRTQSWEMQQKYQIIIDPKDEQPSSPIQIFPAIISEGIRTALELTVQINPNIWNTRFLNADILIKELSIFSHTDIPLGEVIAANPPQFPEKDKGKVSWRMIKLTKPSEEELYKRFENSLVDPSDQLIPSKTFYARFETNVLTDNEIKGFLIAQVKDTLSGIDNIQIFGPLGYKIGKDKYSVNRQTEIKIDFTFDLQSLRIQAHFSPNIQPLRKPVKPNSRLVNKLIEEITSDGQTYIKRVIENPPQTNQANAKIINRFWDIAGRQYIGVYPIDFHLVLIGTEKYSNTDKPDSGETQFEVKISATTSNDEMQNRVTSLQKRLLHIIEYVAEQLK